MTSLLYVQYARVTICSRGAPRSAPGSGMSWMSLPSCTTLSSVSCPECKNVAAWHTNERHFVKAQSGGGLPSPYTKVKCNGKGIAISTETRLTQTGPGDWPGLSTFRLWEPSRTVQGQPTDDGTKHVPNDDPNTLGNSAQTHINARSGWLVP